jgi:G3E family GTPase
MHAHLAVTIVTGLDDNAKSRLVRSLGQPADEQHEQWPDDTDDDFSVALADRLCALADDGHRGALAIELERDTDVVETVLVVRHVLGASRSGAVLRGVVTVQRADDLRALLFRDAPLDDIGLPERLALQLEFATTIVIVDAEAVPSRQLGEIQSLLLGLNPTANLLALGSDGRFRRLATASTRADIAGLGQTTGWILELGGNAGPPATRNGVGCLVYRDPRPFHPGRLAAVVEGWLEPEDAGLILRSRGLVRLASRADRVGSWSTAGGVLALDPTSMTTWHPDTPAGQELVFFGLDLNRDHIERALNSCLLSDDEFVAGPMEWETYHDPFPVWQLEHGH